MPNIFPLLSNLLLIHWCQGAKLLSHAHLCFQVVSFFEHFRNYKNWLVFIPSKGNLTFHWKFNLVICHFINKGGKTVCLHIPPSCFRTQSRSSLTQCHFKHLLTAVIVNIKTLNICIAKYKIKILVFCTREVIFRSE